jgi:KaiC/GvpD/RAD55 family RecA-like ATPase
MESGANAFLQQRDAVPLASSTVPIDLDDARRFLFILDEEQVDFCIRTFDDSDFQRSELAASLTGTFEELAPELARRNDTGAGVFVVVNKGGHRANEITEVRAVFADTDGAPLEPMLACGLEPHMVVESSPGRWHAYWRVEGLLLDQFRAVQQAISAKFGTDPKVHDLSRVMRLPGFFHRKGVPFRSRIIHESGGQPYGAARILAAFPQAVASAPAEVLGAEQVITYIKGMRNSALMSRAGSMRRDGFAEDEIASALLSFNTRACSPPLPAAEVTQVARSAMRYAPEPAPSVGGQEAAESILDWLTGNEGAGAVALRRVRVRNLSSAIAAEVTHAVERLVPDGEVTLLGGHGGSGKTTFAEVLLAHVACGRAWAGHAVSGGPVIFASMEDPAPRVIARVRKIAEAYSLDMDLIEQRFVVLDGTDGEACLAVEQTDRGRTALAFTTAMQELEEAARGARLIVIDNASDAFDANENERRMVRAFIRRLRVIAKENSAGLILLAHVDKQAARMGGAGNSYSGSTAWHNSVRSRLALVEADGVIELRHEKNNLGKKAEPVPLRFTDCGVLVPVFRGDVFDGDDDVLLHCMTAAICRGDIISTARTGPGNAHAHARELPGFPAVLASPRRFWAAVGRLEQDGKILRENYTNAARKSRQRWTTPVAPDAPVIATSANEE